MLVKAGSEIAAYLEDTSNILGQAAVLHIPQNEKELIACLADLVSKKIPLTISGGRTGTTAGCVPFGGALVSLEAFSKIEKVDVAAKVISLEAGATLKSLQSVLDDSDLILPARPTEPLACVGGAVNTAASGVRGLAYGSIRDYIQSLRILLTSGEIIDIRRGDIFAKVRQFDFTLSGKKFSFALPTYKMPAVKSQAGYFVKDNMDLIDLFIGSEGTLGIIIACTLRLDYPAPFVFDGLTFFHDESDAFGFIAGLKEKKEKSLVRPASLEFFDKNSLAMLTKLYSFVPQDCVGIYFEQEADSREAVDKALQTWQDLLVGSKALLDRTFLADSQAEREKLFDFRHALPQAINEFLRAYKQTKVSSDIAVPGAALTEMYEFYVRLGRESGVPYVNFGHIGESHLHFNFLPRNSQEQVKAKICMRKFCEKAISLGGTISAEHGIGKLKKEYLRLMYEESYIRQMAGLKKYFDPHCLLGLDNIFDKEFLF